MQTADVFVSLGGDHGTTVPKYGITVSEIAVLRAIHGNDAVKEIEPKEEIDRGDREEIGRLREIYGHAKIGGADGQVSVMSELFPGAAARAFVSFDQLDLDESFFKAIARVKPEPLPKGEKKGRKAKDAEPESEADAETEDEKLFG